LACHIWCGIWLEVYNSRFKLPASDFPGIVAQTLLFTSIFMGISVIWDKEFGFMKEILVSPISRFSIFLGKMFGDSSSAFLQGIIVFFVGIALGMSIDPLTFLYALPIMLLITFGLVSIGLIIASFMGSLESFGAIQTFINLPLFFLSGALFPLKGPGLNLPSWLTTAAAWNPLTYGVDALRTVILGSAWAPLQIQSLWMDIGILALFDVIMIAIGTWAFSRMK
jgi:ABC-2 type transport system permease protein